VYLPTATETKHVESYTEQFASQSTSGHSDDSLTRHFRVIIIRDRISGTSTKITVHMDCLCTEAIQRAPRPFESIDDIESGDSFPLSVFRVSDGVTNNLEEDEKMI
jgi:hypothetical protein